MLFLSDNGPEEGYGTARPFRGRKRSLFEGGIAAPAIAWLPGGLARGATKGGRAATRADSRNAAAPRSATLSNSSSRCR